MHMGGSKQPVLPPGARRSTSALLSSASPAHPSQAGGTIFPGQRWLTRMGRSPVPSWYLSAARRRSFVAASKPQRFREQSKGRRSVRHAVGRHPAPMDGAELTCLGRLRSNNSLVFAFNYKRKKKPFLFTTTKP